MSTITIEYSDSKKDYTGTEIPSPEFGERLPNGATVIEYKHVDNGSEGWYPNGIVLARINHGLGEYVTWRAGYDVHREVWFCEVGHYFSNIAEAANDYKERF